MFCYLNIMPGSLTRALKVRKGVLNHGSAVLEFKLDQLTSNTERGALNFTVTSSTPMVWDWSGGCVRDAGPCGRLSKLYSTGYYDV